MLLRDELIFLVIVSLGLQKYRHALQLQSRQSQEGIYGEVRGRCRQKMR
jgi:hypothetical protein